MTDWAALLAPQGGASKPKSSLEEKVAASSIAKPVKKSTPSVKSNPFASFSLVDQSLEIPSRCTRGCLDEPRLMVVTESPSVWEYRWMFAHIGDAGHLLQQALESGGADCGDVLDHIQAIQDYFKKGQEEYTQASRDELNQSFKPGEVLFYHLNIGECVEEKEGRLKNKEVSDADMFKSLVAFHQTVCKVKPRHILLLGGGPFEKVLGKTNVSGFAGVTFDYSLPAWLKDAIQSGNQDPTLLEVSSLEHSCLVDVDLHPAFLLQSQRQLPGWKARISSLAKRAGSRIEVLEHKLTYFTEFDKSVNFLEDWLSKPLKDLSYDHETESLSPCVHSRSIILSTNFAKEPDHGYSVPVMHPDITWTLEQRITVAKLIGQLLLKERESTVGLNLLYDNLISRKDPHLGIGSKWLPGKRVECMFLAYCIDENGPQGLKELCNIYTDLKNYDSPLEEWKITNWSRVPDKERNYKDIPWSILGPYGCYDAIANLRVRDALKEKMDQDTRAPLWDIAVELMGVQAQALEEIPFWGQHINRDVVFRAGDLHAKNMDKAVLSLLETTEMREFIDHRKMEIAFAYAVDQASKPMNCIKTWMSNHPAAERDEVKRAFFQVRGLLESGEAVVEGKNLRLVNQKGEEHPLNTYVEETCLFNAQKEFERLGVAKSEKYPELGVEGYVPNFDTNGAQEMGRFFYEHLNLPVEYKSDIGNPSLNEEALDRLAELNPAAEVFHKYKKASKEYGTYFRPVMEAFHTLDRGEVSNLLDPAYLMHLEVYCGKTVTGRTTAQLLQLLPRQGPVKTYFNSRFKGGGILQADLSQIELRVLASVSNEPNMIQAYKNGEDLHTMTTVKIFGDKFLQCVDKALKKEMRSGAKRINFGIAYGSGAPGLVSTLKKEKVEVLRLGGLDPEEVYTIAREELKISPLDYRRRAEVEVHVDKVRNKIAEGLLNDFFKNYPRIEEWISEVHSFTAKHGYYYSPFGRIRRLPNAQCADQKLIAESLRQAQNYPIQSSASDIAVVSMAGVIREMKQIGVRSVPIAAVHDSLVFDCPGEEFDVMAELVRKRMNDCHLNFRELLPSFDSSWMVVPIESDVEIGPDYGTPYAYKEGKLKVQDEKEDQPEQWIPSQEMWSWYNSNKLAA